MKAYYEVAIDQTAKPINSKDGFHLFNREVKKFSTIAEAKAYLKEQYSGHKRVKMYHDRADGNPIHIGYVYSFKDSEYDSGKYRYYWHQDWISVNEIQATPIIIHA